MRGLQSIIEWIIANLLWEAFAAVLAIVGAWFSSRILKRQGREMSLTRRALYTIGAIACLGLLLTVLRSKVFAPERPTPDLPDVHFQVLGAGYFPIDKAPLPSIPDGTLMALITVRATNLGAPTIVTDYAATFQLLSGAQVPGAFLSLRSPWTVTIRGQHPMDMTISPQDLLYNKTGQVIPRGGQAVGFLLVYVPGVDFKWINSPGIILNVTALDAWGRPVISPPWTQTDGAPLTLDSKVPLGAPMPFSAPADHK